MHLNRCCVIGHPGSFGVIDILAFNLCNICKTVKGGGIVTNFLEVKRTSKLENNKILVETKMKSLVLITIKIPALHWVYESMGQITMGIHIFVNSWPMDPQENRITWKRLADYIFILFFTQLNDFLIGFQPSLL